MTIPMIHQGGSGITEGARLGVLIGIFVVCAFVLHNYVNLNIGLKLALGQAVAYFVQWTNREYICCCFASEILIVPLSHESSRFLADLQPLMFFGMDAAKSERWMNESPADADPDCCNVGSHLGT